MTHPGTYHLLAHLDELGLKHQPKVLVFYCGTNDISGGASAAEACDGFVQVFEALRRANPKLRVVYVIQS